MGVRVLDLVTWIASGLALVGVAIACWQLTRARARMRAAQQLAGRMAEQVTAAEAHATQAGTEAEEARSQARWAWEQVKLANAQLERARDEHQSSGLAEQWEWAYALTRSSTEMADAGGELVRIALDQQVAPRYRLAALRHYQQASGRWQETMAKALARTEPTLEVQHQVLTFAQVQSRLHGQVGVLLRAAETGSLSQSDPLADQARGAAQELEAARKRLRRTLSSTLAATSAEHAARSGKLTDSLTGLDETVVNGHRHEPATGQRSA